MNLNALTCTDSYKLGHAVMYVDGTTKVYSNLTPRSDKIYRRNCTQFYDGKIVVLGVQGAVQEIKEMWQESFFSQPKEKVLAKYKRRLDGHLGPDAITINHIAELHDIGYLPIQVKCLPEGSVVNPGIPIMTVTNTVPNAFWLVNYLETVLSNLIWKPCTNATIAREYKAICKHYADITGTDDFSVSIQCHEFAERGMSGPEDSARAGFGHLTQFIGTDTLPAMDYAEDYYDANPDGLIAISVPATEHAVATSNILYKERDIAVDVGENDPNLRLIAEQEFMRDLITRKFPTGIVSYVADSFDFWAVLTDILPNLKDVIMAREASHVAPGKLVIRPDSGDPVRVICGDTFRSADDVVTAAELIVERVREETPHGECGVGQDSEVFLIGGKYIEVGVDIEWNRYDKQYYYEDGYDYHIINEDVQLSAEQKGAIQVLWEIFGGTVTDKGYKLLDSHIGLIYGDSITTKRAEEILRRLAEKGFASGNVGFGVGSYTYQCNTRDTAGMAVKATYTEVNGEGIEIFKDPKTDSKKKSAKGLLFVGKNSEGFFLKDCASKEEEASSENYLQTIFKDGQWVKRVTLEEIRNRLSQS